MSDTTNTTNDVKFAAAEAKAKAKADMIKAIADTAAQKAMTRDADTAKAEVAKAEKAKLAADALAKKAVEAAAAKAKKEADAAEAKAKRNAEKTAKATQKLADDAARKGHRDTAHAEVTRRGADLRATCLCGCGCGQQVPRAVFVPGHDSRLASRVLAALVAGATIAEVRALVCAAVAQTETNKVG